ncbi:MAG: hypothetical protein AAGA66_01055 [Bacteroidota bacterium]
MRRTFFLFSTYLLLATSCSDDDEAEDVFSKETYEAAVNINPANFPAGVGLDLSAGDTGRVVQLDEVTDVDWDLMIITYRTSKGGRPGIFLHGDVSRTDAVMALNASDQSGEVATGAVGFASFVTVSQEMQGSIAPDGVFDFDPDINVDAMGKPDVDLLMAAYEKLVIGNSIINLDEAEQPVYLVRSKEGTFFKFQFVGLEGGGNISLRWARFGSDALQ